MNIAAAATSGSNLSLTYFLYSGPAGMSVDPLTGNVTWSPDASSLAQTAVILQVYDTNGGHATQGFTIQVTNGVQPPVFAPIASPIQGSEGQPLQVPVSAVDPQRPSELCLATVDLLASILASEAGNLALKVLATGGVYLAGGIALHIVKLLEQPRFVETFTRKGRFKDLMARIPIHIITTQAALVGAATFGLQSLTDLKKREAPKASLAPV